MARYAPDLVSLQDATLQRFSRKSDKDRVSHRYRARRKIIGKTAEDLARQKAARALRNQAFKTALEHARQKVWALAQSLREDFRSHSSEYYYQLLMQSSRLRSNKRKVSRWNAFLSQEIRRINAGMCAFIFLVSC